ncbi:MAG: PQQ-binding-like beta-propeller repeat protein [Gemmataceae bacterium]
MRKLTLTWVTCLTIAATAQAQPDYRVLTRPTVPQRDALERMNLEVAWRARVKLDGNRDSLAHLQLLPHPDTGILQVAVQTAAGSLILFDGESGDVQWRAQIGPPYWSSQPVAHNAYSIYATRRDMLYILERNTGRHRVYHFHPDSKEKAVGYKLDFVPSTGLTADDERLYVPMGNRILTYQIPQYELLAKKAARKPEDIETFGALHDSPQPELRWSALEVKVQYDQPPLVSTGQIGMVSSDGRLLSFNKYENILRYEFHTNGGITAPAGQYKNIAYLGSLDSVVYAVDMNTERILWRFLAGQQVDRQPFATDNDIFVKAKRGLTRLERSSGKVYWANPDGSNFLATNSKYVYATDRQGKLLVLDGWRGATLAKLDMRDWILLVPNEWTDRIYLAAHDGQVLCLRCRDYQRPLVIKTVVTPKKKDEPQIEEEKKEPEKKEDEKKEEKKEAAHAAPQQRWNAPMFCEFHAISNRGRIAIEGASPVVDAVIRRRSDGADCTTPCSPIG